MALNKLQIPPQSERNSDLSPFNKRTWCFPPKIPSADTLIILLLLQGGRKPKEMRETRTCEYNTRHRHTFS